MQHVLDGARALIEARRVAAIALEFSPSSLKDMISWEKTLTWLLGVGYEIHNVRCADTDKTVNGNRGCASLNLKSDLAAVKEFLGSALSRLGVDGTTDFWLDLKGANFPC